MKRMTVLPMVILLAAGCHPVAPTTSTSPVRVEPSQAGYLPGTTVKADTDSPTAIDQAMIWAERYTHMVAERDAALERAREAERGQDDAEKRARDILLELETTRRQLDDADKMMRELKADLDRWKRDVLGFRKEILEAQAAELEALRQIMKVLGGHLSEQDSTDGDRQGEDQP